MDEIVKEIVALEWEDFQKVRNAGGRAACQDEKRTFEINRQSQFLAWSPEARASYLGDLKAARVAGRNLLMEKYARMMAWTHPDEYKRLEQSLPGLPPVAFSLTDRIAALQLAWHKEFAAAHPKLAARGRPLHGGGAADDDTSFEVYLRGELLTYSVPTLSLYLTHLENLKRQGRNLSLELMEHLARLSGYASLTQAEERS